MTPLHRALAVLALSVSSVLPVAALAVEAAPAPAAARFYPLVGNWKGNGELREGDQSPAKLKLTLQCQKASAGWAVLCTMKASNDKMAMAETDLFGVDPASGKGHWYAVTNQGETHDHSAEWSDANTMKGRFAWVQEGKQMEENVTFKVNGQRTLEFRSTVSENGKTVGAFSGTLKR